MPPRRHLHGPDQMIGPGLRNRQPNDSDDGFPPTFGPPTPLLLPDPRRAEKSWNKGGKLRMVWPKDKPHISKWDRFKDCLTDKGPDIFIATGCGAEDPHRPVWSGWKTREFQSPRDRKPRWDNLGYDFTQYNEVASWDKAARRGEQNVRRRYDFATRKYVRPRGGELSDVIWDPRNQKHALCSRDAYGNEFVAPRYDCNDFNRGYGPNPFWTGEIYDHRRDHRRGQRWQHPWNLDFVE